MDRIVTLIDAQRPDRDRTTQPPAASVRCAAAAQPCQQDIESRKDLTARAHDNDCQKPKHHKPNPLSHHALVGWHYRIFRG